MHWGTCEWDSTTWHNTLLLQANKSWRWSWLLCIVWTIKQAATEIYGPTILPASWVRKILAASNYAVNEATFTGRIRRKIMTWLIRMPRYSVHVVTEKWKNKIQYNLPINFRNLWQDTFTCSNQLKAVDLQDICSLCHAHVLLHSSCISPFM